MNWAARNQAIRQFVIFGMGGIMSASIDLGVTKLLLVFNTWYITAVSVGFLSGFGVNFLYNAKITFSSQLSKIAFLRYVIVVLVNYFLTLLLVAMLKNLFGESVMFGKILSLPIIALHSYLWSKLWIYRAQ